MNCHEEQMKAQETLVNELEQELGRLNSEFATLLKEAKLSEEDLTEPDPHSLTPPLRAAYEEAVGKAQREGKARATQSEPVSATSSLPGARRKDLIRL